MSKTIYIMNNGDLVPEDDESLEFLEDGKATYKFELRGYIAEKRTSYVIKELNTDYLYAFTVGSVFKRDMIVKWTGRSTGLGYGEFVDNKGKMHNIPYSLIKRVAK